MRDTSAGMALPMLKALTSWPWYRIVNSILDQSGGWAWLKAGHKTVPKTKPIRLYRKILAIALLRCWK